MRVKIVNVPRGEAPEEVRRAWVGMELPLAHGRPGLSAGLVFGVKSGPKGFWATVGKLLGGQARAATGYVIDADVAFVELAAQRPEAAAWWRDHAPHLFGKGRRLMFDAGSCQVVAAE